MSSVVQYITFGMVLLSEQKSYANYFSDIPNHSASEVLIDLY